MFREIPCDLMILTGTTLVYLEIHPLSMGNLLSTNSSKDSSGTTNGSFPSLGASGASFIAVSHLWEGFKLLSQDGSEQACKYRALLA